MNSSEHHADSLIIGAGVIGLTLAWQLAGRGRKVCVIDAGRMGKGQSGASSWAGAGILPPAPSNGIIDPLDNLKSLSHTLQSHWWDMIHEESGIDPGYRRCGGIYLACSPGELATLVANQQWWNEHGVAFQKISNRDLQTLEPALYQNSYDAVSQTDRADILAAWLLPDEAQIRNPKLLQALVGACQFRGVELIENTIISDIASLQGETDLLKASTNCGRSFRAAQICLCAGAWTRKFLDAKHVSNGLLPVRGQMLLYEFPQAPIHRVINEGNRYIVAREDGHVLCGSIEEEVGFQAETTEAALREIRLWAERILPLLKQSEPVKSWAGLRPGSYDGLPYLGQAPGHKNLYLATGHFRSGIHLSCATAQCLADLMCDEDPTIDLMPFRISRG